MTRIEAVNQVTQAINQLLGPHYDNTVFAERLVVALFALDLIQFEDRERPRVLDRVAPVTHKQPQEDITPVIASQRANVTISYPQGLMPASQWSAIRGLGE